MLTQLNVHFPDDIKAPRKEVSVVRSKVFESETLTLRVLSKDYKGETVSVHEIVLFGTPKSIDKIVDRLSRPPAGARKEGADGG